jgi:hypothetical protein
MAAKWGEERWQRDKLDWIVMGLLGRKKEASLTPILAI